jgi:hypothetical protein
VLGDAITALSEARAPYSDADPMTVEPAPDPSTLALPPAVASPDPNSSWWDGLVPRRGGRP